MVQLDFLSTPFVQSKFVRQILHEKEKILWKTTLLTGKYSAQFLFTGCFSSRLTHSNISLTHNFFFWYVLLNLQMKIIQAQFLRISKYIYVHVVASHGPAWNLVLITGMHGVLARQIYQDTSQV